MTERLPNQCSQNVRDLALFLTLALAAAGSAPAHAESSTGRSSGVYVVIAPNFTEARQLYLDGLWPVVRNALVAERDVVGGVKRDITSNGSLSVAVQNTDRFDHAKQTVTDALSRQTEIAGIDGAAYDIKVEFGRITTSFDEATSKEIDARLTANAYTALQMRLDAFGYDEVHLTQISPSKVLIVGPEIDDPSAFLSLLSSQGKLLGYPVISRTNGNKPQAGTGRKVITDKFDDSLHFEVDDIVRYSNDHFKEFEGTADMNGQAALRFWLTDAGTQAFDEVQDIYPGDITAYALDGEAVSVLMDNVVRISPNEGVLVNDRGVADADFIAKLLNSGPLPVSMRILEYREISPPMPIR